MDPSEPLVIVPAKVNECVFINFTHGHACCERVDAARHVKFKLISTMCNVDWKRLRAVPSGTSER